MGTTIKSLSLISLLLFLFTSTSSARQHGPPDFRKSKYMYSDLFDSAASRHFQEVDIRNAPIEQLNPANQVQETRIRHTMADHLSTLFESVKANFPPNTDILCQILNDYLELPFKVETRSDMRLQVVPDSLEMLPFSAEVNYVRHIRKELFRVEHRRQAEEARIAAERKAEEERLAAEIKAAGSLSRSKLYQKVWEDAKKTELVRQAQDELLAAELEKCEDKIHSMVEETVTNPYAPAQCKLKFTFEDFTHRLHDHYQLWASDKKSSWREGDYVTVRDQNTGTFEAGVYKRRTPAGPHVINVDGQSRITLTDEIHTLPRITIDNDTLWYRFEDALRARIFEQLGYTVLIRRADPNSYQVLVSWGGWAHKWADGPPEDIDISLSHPGQTIGAIPYSFIYTFEVARHHALLLGKSDKRLVAESIKGPLRKTGAFEDMIMNTFNLTHKGTLPNEQNIVIRETWGYL